MALVPLRAETRIIQISFMIFFCSFLNEQCRSFARQNPYFYYFTILLLIEISYFRILCNSLNKSNPIQTDYHVYIFDFSFFQTNRSYRYFVNK